jgi:hypothetical protein
MICPNCSWTPEKGAYPFLFETTYWRAVLVPNQCLLGRCVVNLKRHAGDLVDLTQFEDPEFGSPYNHQRSLVLPVDIRERIVVRIRQDMTNAL